MGKFIKRLMVFAKLGNWKCLHITWINCLIMRTKKCTWISMNAFAMAISNTFVSTSGQDRIPGKYPNPATEPGFLCL